MSNLYDTIVIGAGQAGLASAYYLQRARSRFLVLDGGGQIGESWLRRWDSLRLFTPVRYNSLPGLPFPGEPYALPVKDAVARYLEAYVGHFALPVRLNTRVSSLVRDADRFVVTTDGETFTARSVIVATGAYHWAYIPAFASALSPSLEQRHSSEYRNPSALPPGSVLVVGAGNSGAQIALELAESGRPTWLSGRDTGSIPRRVLGRDVYDWLWWTVMRPSVDSWVGRRLMGQLFAGDPLVGFSRRALMIPKLTSVGRTVGVSGRPTPVEPEAFKLVAALDLSLMVPALTVGGVLLWRRAPWGYLLAAIAGIQGALYLLVLSVNSIIAIQRGFATAPGELPIWGSLTLVTTTVAFVLLANVRRESAAF